jgi:hypothetical protein
MSMNKESINDLKQIIHSVFICGNTMYNLPEELCEEFYNQIVEVLKVGTL